MEITDRNGIVCNYAMSATLKITQDSPAVVFESHVSAASGSLVDIEAPAQVGACYTSSIDARGEGLRDVDHDGPVCWAGPPECDTCPRDACEVNPQECNNSPLVLRLASGAYELTGLDDPVSFDIDADGQAEIIGWTGRRSQEGFLALDRNQNSRIDDGSELFGDATPLPDGRVAANGFEALAYLDSDRNGVVGPNDDAWSELLLWIDLDHDGVSHRSELTHLDTFGIDWLAYDYWITNRRDSSGNAFRYASHFGIGRSRRTYYDVFFVGRR